MATATFGAGCFWKTEDSFRGIEGVIATSVGYMGGYFPNPSYLDVLSRITGHAEVAQIEYDADRIGYGRLLEIFWSIHDPTQLDRQGPDRGEQYRSIIFYEVRGSPGFSSRGLSDHTSEQEQIARQSKRQLEESGKYETAIVTRIQLAMDYYLGFAE